MKTLRNITQLLLILLLLTTTVHAKFFYLGRIRIGGGSLSSASALAKYDILLTNRGHYDDLGGNAYSQIKALNPSIQIYPYGKINLSVIGDVCNTLYAVSVSRWDGGTVGDCGHSQGDIVNDNNGFVLRDSLNNYVELSGNYPTQYWMKFGDSSTGGYQEYAIEAIRDEMVLPWYDNTDGFYADQCFVVRSGLLNSPTLYPDNAAWTPAMNSMMAAFTQAMHIDGVKFVGNRGPLDFTSSYSDAIQGWIDQDTSSYPMDVALSESTGAFGTHNGTGVVQFKSQTIWKAHIDMMNALDNTSAWIYVSTDHVNMGDTGVDNYGYSITGWQALWFAIASYAIGMNNNNPHYFEFAYDGSNSAYNQEGKYYYDEYDYIDLGNPISTYQILNQGGTNIYWRAFDTGYVFVNPTTSSVTSINLSSLGIENVVQRTHENLTTDKGLLPYATTLDLDGHRGAILIKASVPDTGIFDKRSGSGVRSVRSSSGVIPK